MSENWKVGKEEKKGIRKEIEHCILIAVIDEKHTENQVLEYLEELRLSLIHISEPTRPY